MPLQARPACLTRQVHWQPATEAVPLSELIRARARSDSESPARGSLKSTIAAAAHASDRARPARAVGHY